MVYGRFAYIFCRHGGKAKRKKEMEGGREEGREREDIFEYMFIYIYTIDRKSRELNFIYLEL